MAADEPEILLRDGIPIGCTHLKNGYRCYRDIKFVGRLETEEKSSVFACASHLVSELRKHVGGRFVVVPIGK